MEAKFSSKGTIQHRSIMNQSEVTSVSFHGPLQESDESYGPPSLEIFTYRQFYMQTEWRTLSIEI